MKFDIKKINFKRLILPATVVAVFVAVFVVAPHTAKALTGFVDGMGSLVVSLLSWIFQSFVYVMGNLLIKAIEILIKVLSYSDFINAPIVVKGWTVIRDTCNIGITIALLLMSFYTIFRSKSYQYQSALPKLIAAAILINFSKVITGFMIDISQVFMMTFVNAFKDAAAGNLTYGFGLEDMLKFGDLAGRGLNDSGVTSVTDLSSSINNWSVFGGLVLGSLMVLVAFVIVLALIVMMMVRILALWFLTLFSPVAFLAGVIPGKTDDVWKGKWWGELSKYLVQGPIVGFMLWLSFAVISEMTASKHIMVLQFQSQLAQGNVSGTDVGWQAFANKISGTQNIVDYLVTCGLLIMTLILASKTGIAGSKIAGNFMSKLEGTGQKILAGGQKIATSPLRGAKNLAGAGWKASQIPYMANALATRFKTSDTGKILGLDKEYKEGLATLRKGRAETMLGGDRFRGSLRSAEAQLAGKQRETMKKSGLFETKDTLYSTFSSMIKSGDKIGAQAVLRESAEKGWMTQTMMDEYQTNFGYKKTGQGTNTKRGEDEAILEEVLWAAQGKGGDAFADYKSNVERNAATGIYETKNIMAVKKKLQDDTEKEDLRDLRGKITAKNLTGGVDENGNPKQSLELDFILGLAGHQDEIGKVDKGKRTIIADAIKNILANKEKWSVNTEQEKTLGAFYQHLSMDAQDFDKQTGALKTTPAVTTKLAGKILTPDTLSEAKIKLSGKGVDYKRDMAEAAKEKNAAIDDEMAEIFYQQDETMASLTEAITVALGNAKDKLRSLDENSSGIDIGNFYSDLKSSLMPLRNEIIRRRNELTKQIDPKTGQPYKLGELYDESQVNRSIELIDNIIVPMTLPGSTKKLDSKKKKIVDDSLSYMTAHLKGTGGRKARKELIKENKVRQVSRQFADIANDRIGVLKMETDPTKRMSFLSEAHEKVRRLVEINAENPDKNYIRNANNLLQLLQAGLSGATTIDTQYIDDVQTMAGELKNQYSKG